MIINDYVALLIRAWVETSEQLPGRDGRSQEKLALSELQSRSLRLRIRLRNLFIDKSLFISESAPTPNNPKC